MCYEWSGWYRKARAKDDARKQAPVEQVSQRESTEVVEPQPAATPTPPKQREKVPA